jgi:hypothetical protein
MGEPGFKHWSPGLQSQKKARYISVTNIMWRECSELGYYRGCEDQRNEEDWLLTDLIRPPRGGLVKLTWVRTRPWEQIVDGGTLVTDPSSSLRPFISQHARL